MYHGERWLNVVDGASTLLVLLSQHKIFMMWQLTWCKCF